MHAAHLSEASYAYTPTASVLFRKPDNQPPRPEEPLWFRFCRAIELLKLVHGAGLV